MEAVLLHSSMDQSISPYKSMRNHKRNNNRPIISRPSENSVPPSSLYSNFRGGLFHAPPFSVSFAHPPSLSILNPQQQPPLLPLPISKSYNNNSRNRGLSCPPINRKINRARGQSLTPKKSKPSISPKKGDDTNRDLKSMMSSECLMIASTNRLGPEPKDFLKDVSRVSSSSSSGNNNNLEKFSGSSSILSPPPSSLPLPTFSLRPKRSCNPEAGAIDAGATDNLRRLLRLR